MRPTAVFNSMLSAFSTRSHETKNAAIPNAAIPTSGREMVATRLKKVKESAADAFARFDRSVDDIKAAIGGNPHTVISTVIKTGETEKGKWNIRQKKEKAPPRVTQVELGFVSFFERPAEGERERRRNDCLRSILDIMPAIGTSPDLPGHAEAGFITGLDKSGSHVKGRTHVAASGNSSGLLNQAICTDDQGTIFLHHLQNVDDVKRVQAKLMQEREIGEHGTEDKLIGLITDLQKFGRTYYLRDKDAPLDVLEQRLSKKQNSLEDAFASRDGQGAYASRATANDEQEITELKKDIKALKEIIFARSHQLSLQSGEDNQKLKGKSSAGGVFHTIRRHAATNYLGKNEQSRRKPRQKIPDGFQTI